MKQKSIAIIGAGPGGLAAAMILAGKGHHVTVYEMKDQVGGRNGRFQLQGYTFDIGPTFFIYPPILEEVFSESGLNLKDYITLKPLDPLYRLQFGDKAFYPSSDTSKMLAEIERVYPGHSQGYLDYLKGEAKRFEKLAPILKMPFQSPLDFFRPTVLKGAGELDPLHTLYDRLKSYFKHEELIYSMAFQAKYLGMSPWVCPSAFSILSYMEHAFGLFHVDGGLNQVAAGMANAATDLGATLHLSTKVTKVNFTGAKATSISLDNGQTITADAIVLNGDFGAAMTDLVDETQRPGYTNQQLKKKKVSCSAFMLYLGVDKQYEQLEHHNIIFSDPYKANVDDLTTRMKLTPNAAFYLHNPVATDPSMAPEGHSALFVLVPVPNNRSGIDWENIKQDYAKDVKAWMKKRLDMTDLDEHIVVEKILTPLDWEKEFGVFDGAVFNLAHSLDQMLIFRPNNRFRPGLYLVGGGTHPGSGLPTIYQSGLITARLLHHDLTKKG